MWIYFIVDSLSRNLAFDCFMFMPEISNRMVFVNGKHPSWLFTKADEKLTRGYREQHQLVVKTGFEPATYGFQIRRSNHSATLPPLNG